MLDIGKLIAGYGSGPVVRGVDLAVAAGEVVTILGRNGSGKSSLIKAIMGLLPEIEGRVRLGETVLSGLRAHDVARRGVAYVPQGRGIFPRLTVRENLELGTRALGPGARVPDSVFELFPILAQRLGQFGGTMSGGEQQMLAIARALCAKPRALLLDEPSDGVQPSIVQMIGQLVPRIARDNGLAVLLVEQNLDLALAAAGRAVVLDRGRIVHDGPSDAFRDPLMQRQFLAIS